MSIVKVGCEDGTIKRAESPKCCPIPDELQNDFMLGCWGLFDAIRKGEEEEFKKHCNGGHTEEELKRLRKHSIINEGENPKVCEICATIKRNPSTT